MQESDITQPGSTGITERLNALEMRIAGLEKELRGLRKTRPAEAEEEENPEDYRLSLKFSAGREEDGGIETRIGEYGLSWLGNIVLFFGIVFLSQYFVNTGHPLIAALAGFAAVAGMLALSLVLRRSYAYMASIFNVFARILLFYTVVRLHWFTDHPVLGSAPVTVVLLFLISVFQYAEGFKRRSEGWAVLGLLLATVLCILSDHTHVMLPLVVLTALTAVLLFNRFGWQRLLVFTVILNYGIFMVWIINNPFMGHPARAVDSHQFAYIYLAAVGAIYSMTTLIRQKGLFPDNMILTTVILNGLGFSAVLALIVLTFFQAGYIWIFVSIAVFCLGFSALLKYRSPWKYSPALYALYGFIAASIAFYGIWNVPRVFLMLSFQSLLVVSMALWFRSRIIVVMNLFLFIFLIAAYAVSSGQLHLVNFAFPAVAFFSARIINWQKDRLNIKTELIRNTYLILLFLTLLYAIYKAVPGQYVTVSWTVTAAFYFGLSIFLKNVKYRYLAVATMLATAVYLFAVDLDRIGMVYRIIAFLFLALISIGISAYYVRKLKVNRKSGDQLTG